MSFRQVGPVGWVRMVPNTSASDGVREARRQPCAPASACAAAASADILSAVPALTGVTWISSRVLPMCATVDQMQIIRKSNYRVIWHSQCPLGGVMHERPLVWRPELSALGDGVLGR